MAASVQVQGQDEISRALRSLEPRVAKKIVRSSLIAPAKTLAEAAKALAPVKTGALKAAIKPRSRKKSRKPVVGRNVVIGQETFKGDHWYGGVQEYGWMQGKRGTEGRKHIEGYHFMERAYEQKGNDVARDAMQRIILGIQEEAKK